MPFRYRRRLALGPLRLNVTQRGLRSVALKLGAFTWNLTHRRVTTNLPGSGLYHELDLRTFDCRCACAVENHGLRGCTRCPCRKYRRAS